MDSVTAIDVVRDRLRFILTDPYGLSGGQARAGSEWIYSDEPRTGYRHPQIQIKKVDNPSEPIDIGPNYTEFEQLFLNVWVYSKNGFKFTVSGTEYTNAKAVEYLMGQVKSLLKDDFNNLFDNGAKMYKHINTTTVEYDPDNQLYFGAATIRVAYFNR